MASSSLWTGGLVLSCLCTITHRFVSPLRASPMSTVRMYVSYMDFALELTSSICISHL